MSDWKCKPLKENRFSWYQWIFHYLGIARIVYDSVGERWHIRPNGYNPLFWIFVFVSAPIMPFFTAKTISQTLQGVKKIVTQADELLWKLYQKDENGQPKYMSYRKVLREGKPKH